MNPIPDTKQIRTFIALEKTRSFTAAANAMGLTQSAVSHSIKALESHLDCILIERLGKKCILTPHGEVFLHHAKKAVAQLEEASEKMVGLTHSGYSSLKIGVSHSLCQYVIPKSLDAFYKKSTQAEVFITTGDTLALLNDLGEGKLDMAFGIHRNAHENDYRFVPLFQDELCFVTSANHAWVKDKDSAKDYTKERFITYGNDSATTQILNAHLEGLGIRQRASISICNTDSIKEMVSLELGVGIISEWVAKTALQGSKLVKHSISPTPVRQWGYYLNKTKSLSLPEEEFTNLFSKELIEVISKK